MRPNQLLLLKPVVALAALFAAAATSGCSKGELSAAERNRGGAAVSSAGAIKVVGGDSGLPRQTPVPADTSDLLPIVTAPAQSQAPASIEEILKRSPLRAPKADCATPVTAVVNGTEVGTQCPTDAPPKK